MLAQMLTLKIKASIEKTDQESWQAAADTVQPLIAFLKCLDGVKAPTQHFGVHYSKIQPENLPISQEIQVYSSDQAVAIGHILLGWVRLSPLKQIEVSSHSHRYVIDYETRDVEELMLRLC
jgi:hypothetical protein